MSKVSAGNEKSKSNSKPFLIKKKRIGYLKSSVIKVLQWHLKQKLKKCPSSNLKLSKSNWTLLSPSASSGKVESWIFIWA